MLPGSCNASPFVTLVRILFLSFQFASAQTVNIIPLPKSFIKLSGAFQLNSNIVIGMNDNSMLPQANYLQMELKRADGILIAVDPDEQKAQIDLKLVDKPGVNGAYDLKIEANKISITASGNDGIFYGLVSLMQLIRMQPAGNSVSLAACEIADAPRFQWRGFMLDESRHFFGREKVEQLLNWMAFYKLNKFHWHLTDDDGWRLEIKKYPRLAQVGGIGNHTDSLAPAKYYTQEDIKEIVAYAQDRFITVIPEIDMPGHATAANKAYPEYSGGSIRNYENYTFDPGNEKTYSYLTAILKEANGLFPSHMIHLGGDEVALGNQAWAGRPGIKDMMAKNNFTALEDLEHYFFNRMADSVMKMNVNVLCWDEAASTNLNPAKTIVFWWRQNFPSQLELSLQKKYDVVLCPRLPLYFDFVQDKNNVSGRRWNGAYFNSLSNIYNFPDRQLPSAELNSNLILGIQANIWTETVGSEKRLDYMTYPRIAALAESAWTDRVLKNESSFNERLKADLTLYDRDGIYYYNPFDPGAHPEAIDFIRHTPKREKAGRHRKHAHEKAARGAKTSKTDRNGAKHHHIKKGNHRAG
ncbi:beta-N-acetylhexosaminidase [Mucilaginibacter gotjawali]|uniref:beta-N-acetylhexosaminidase n=1 Tax=Mucilaginibacter gotjawali TaxID=1550579 RepID=UPI00288BCF0C|nr:beta-N-acetylhexosaminidase [Mucilaginibacter gotjawali]